VERAPASASATAVATGTLALDLSPAAPLQVFVDGYYVGMTDQIGSTFELPVGPHDVELRGDGYEPVRFSVRIAAAQSVTYRQTLHASDRTPPAPQTPRAPVTLYVIAGCYAGNVEPDVSALPKGCDVSQLHTIER
jgi:hypothetical protein